MGLGTLVNLDGGGANSLMQSRRSTPVEDVQENEEEQLVVVVKDGVM